MFEKATKKQKIVLNALMIIDTLNWAYYNDDGSITVQLEHAYYGFPKNYTITKKGKIL